MKKIFLILILFLCLFLIYYEFNTEKINYVSIGENANILDNYNNIVYEYLKSMKKRFDFNNYFSDSTIEGLIKDVKNNRTIHVNGNDYYLKKELRESDVLVINIGQSELAKNYNKYNMQVNQEVLNNLYEDVEKLIKEIRLYAKEKIIFIGFYNPTNYYDSSVDSLFYQLNYKLNKLMQNNKIIYLELYNEIKNNKYKNKNNSYLNINGIRKVANLIKKYLN